MKFNSDNKYVYLKSGSNNECYYHNGIVAKIFYNGKPGYKPEPEAKYMKKANEINSLAVKFLDIKKYEDCTVIFMEKLTRVNKDLFTLEKRKQMLAMFEVQLKELHANDIYHIDIKNPYGRFDNVIITEEAIRLIDWGRSKELAAYGKSLVWNKEWEDVYAFSSWFLS